MALLQRSLADGRLTQAQLGERAGAAYAARAGVQLRDLTADLPDAGQQPPRPGMTLDPRLGYWLLSLRETALLRAWLMALARDRGSPVCSPPAHASDMPGAKVVTRAANSRRSHTAGAAQPRAACQGGPRAAGRRGRHSRQ